MCRDRDRDRDLEPDLDLDPEWDLDLDEGRLPVRLLVGVLPRRSLRKLCAPVSPSMVPPPALDAPCRGGSSPLSLDALIICSYPVE